MTDGLEEAIAKMRADGAAPAAIDAFSYYYRRAAGGETGMLPESEIEPLESLPDAEALPDPGAEGRRALARAVVLKLNGGLGTSMGMTRAKSLIEAKEGRSFLDIIVRQVLATRRAAGVRLPLVLMNSFYTRGDSLAALERYRELEVDVPLDFVQGRVPKLTEDEMRPVQWPADPELEWAPPGHGDIYTSLATSGMLDDLLGHDYEYAFVSNSDNLGAVLDERVLAWFARERLPFAMEVADRTEADRKGGHPARRKGGGLVLRETAQTPPEDLEALQDISRHRYVNTNNLWINLRALAEVQQREGMLRLPMIVNRKTVDPSDASSTPVIQLETAMGAAIGAFEGAAAIHVPRRRFAPVKTTNDLLAVRSDAYVLGADEQVALAAERVGPPFIDLDPPYFKLLRDFDARFPAGPPSLVSCERLVVRGDVAFGRAVTVRGVVTVENRGEARLEIDDGAKLQG